MGCVDVAVGGAVDHVQVSVVGAKRILATIKEYGGVCVGGQLNGVLQGAHLIYRGSDAGHPARHFSNLAVDLRCDIRSKRLLFFHLVALILNTIAWHVSATACFNAGYVGMGVRTGSINFNATQARRGK